MLGTGLITTRVHSEQQFPTSVEMEKKKKKGKSRAREIADLRQSHRSGVCDIQEWTFVTHYEGPGVAYYGYAESYPDSII